MQVAAGVGVGVGIGVGVVVGLGVGFGVGTIEVGVGVGVEVGVGNAPEGMNLTEPFPRFGLESPCSGTYEDVDPALVNGARIKTGFSFTLPPARMAS